MAIEPGRAGMEPRLCTISCVVVGPASHLCTRTSHPFTMHARHLWIADLSPFSKART